MTTETQKPNVQNLTPRFSVECQGVTINCVGVQALEAATRVVSGPANQRVSSFANLLGGALMEQMKPFMPPEQRARGEQGPDGTKQEDKEAFDNIFNLQGTQTGRFSSEHPNKSNTGKPAEVPPAVVPVEQVSEINYTQTIPVTRKIKLGKEEVAAFDLALECMGQGTKLRAAIEAFNDAPFLTMTKADMVKKGLAKNDKSATGIIAQIRNKCANAAELQPDKIIFKDVNSGNWCLNVRFAEYLDRRDN